MKPVFVTGNINKVMLLNHMLGYELEHKNLDLDEVQDLDPVVVAEHKARQAFKLLKQPVLIEDTSLVFNAMGKMPGPLIKWFLQEIGNEGCCKILDNFYDRSAVAQVTYVLYNGKTTQVFEAKLDGVIADKPRGSKGFGWDVIFIPQGSTQTFGEMKEQSYYDNSVRSMVVGRLKAYIDTLAE